MKVRVNKKDKIIILDYKKISHFEIIPAWDKGIPTLQAIVDHQETVAICEREKIEECLDEMNQIFRGEEIERESKVKELVVSIKYDIEIKNPAPTPKNPAEPKQTPTK